LILDQCPKPLSAPLQMTDRDRGREGEREKEKERDELSILYSILMYMSVTHFVSLVCLALIACRDVHVHIHVHVHIYIHRAH